MNGLDGKSLKKYKDIIIISIVLILEIVYGMIFSSNLISTTWSKAIQIMALIYDEFISQMVFITIGILLCAVIYGKVSIPYPRNKWVSIIVRICIFIPLILYSYSNPRNYCT